MRVGRSKMKFRSGECHSAGSHGKNILEAACSALDEKLVRGATALLAIALTGCAGSTSKIGGNPTGDLVSSGTEYVATLKGGGHMYITMLKTQDGTVLGDFVIGALPVSLADQSGDFEGDFDGSNFAATAHSLSGKSFTLSGVKSGSELMLTRSDLPDETLTFAPIAHPFEFAEFHARHGHG